MDPDAWVHDTFGVNPATYAKPPSGVAAAPNAAPAPNAAVAPGGPPPGPQVVPPGAPRGGLGAPASAPKPTPESVLAKFEASPEIHADIKNLAIDQLRPIVDSLAQTAHAQFLSAMNTAAGLAEKRAAAEKKSSETKLAIAIALGTLFFAPAAEAAALAAVQAIGPTMVNSVVAAGAKYGKFAKLDSDEEFIVTANLLTTLYQSKALTLAREFNSAGAKAAVKAGTDIFKATGTSILPTSDQWANTVAYLHALANEAGEGKKGLTDLIFTGVKTFDELVGLYNYFKATSLSFYEAVLTREMEDFATEIAAPMAAQVKRQLGMSGGSEMIVQMNAYGRMRFARVLEDAEPGLLGSGITYVFRKWVTPDMEAQAKKLCVKEIDPKWIEGHLPAPEQEANPARVVQMNAWGRDRLAIVHVSDEGMFSVDHGVMTFAHWVDAKDESSARAQGSAQIGGINVVLAKDVHGIQAPVD